MPVVIGYQDYAAMATFGGAASFVTGLPLTNVQDPDPRTVARTASADPADTQFTVNLGAARPVGLIAIGPLNMSPGSTGRIRGYSDAGMSSEVYDTGVLTVEGTLIDWADTDEWLAWEDVDFWLGVSESEVAELPLYLIHVVPAASAAQATAQFWKVTLEDTANFDGYIDIGGVHFMRVHRPAWNYGEGNSFELTWLTDVAESLGGLRTWWNRGMRRRLRLTWSALPQDEVFDDWFRIALKSRTDKPVFLVPEEGDDVTNMRKRAFLATLTATPAIQQIVHALAAVSIDAEEVI
jgi:hypothetical protein